MTNGFDMVPPGNGSASKAALRASMARVLDEAETAFADRHYDSGKKFSVASGATRLGETRRKLPLGGFYAQGALINGNRYFSKVRSCSAGRRTPASPDQRKGPVDDRLHAVGRDRIHHRLKIFN